MSSSVSESLQAAIAAQIQAADGWLPFDDFMHAALYTPGLGYYAGGLQKFGHLPSSGSDFATAPEMSPWFGRSVAAQMAQLMQATGIRDLYEFGAGSGALALQIYEHLLQISSQPVRYFIVELSAELRARQQDRLRHLGDQVQWLDTLPTQFDGLIIGNEVLDAMPVKLLQRTHGVWHERGVAMHDQQFIWQDRPTPLRPPLEVSGSHDYLCEIHPHAEAFMRTIAHQLQRGAALFIDYGFPESEFYHPQRHMGSLMTHQLHKSDPDPLSQVGLKDITAHVNFTGIAVAAQEAELDTLGYTSQGRFLLNCGLLDQLHELPSLQRSQVARLINEHEMGELFKVIALGKNISTNIIADLIGFTQGDRTHTL